MGVADLSILISHFRKSIRNDQMSLKKQSRTNIALTDPKSPVNVGAVMRAAGCFGVEEIFYTGERFDRAVKFNTDTKNANKKIALTRIDDLMDCAQEMTKMVCVELVEGAIPLTDYQHPERVTYIFGPEDGTIAQDVIDKADAVVYIPTIGCLNLAATVNIVLYDRLAKSPKIRASDELIRQSRDTNNKVKVKT